MIANILFDYDLMNKIHKIHKKLMNRFLNKFDQLLKELEMNFQAGTDFTVDSKAFNFKFLIPYP